MVKLSFTMSVGSDGDENLASTEPRIVARLQRLLEVRSEK